MVDKIVVSNFLNSSFTGIIHNRWSEFYEKHRFAFWLIITLLAVSTMLFFIPWMSWLFPTKNNHFLECFAWLLITCSFCGLLPAAFLFGRGREYPHSFYQIYGIVFFLLIGVILGVSFLIAIFEYDVFFFTVVYFIIIYHFSIRHIKTEKKKTAHLGQRGTPEEIKKELILGQIGNVLQILFLILIFILTQHSLWLFGALIFLFNYIIGVRIHHEIFNNPLTYGLALITLFGLCLLVLVLGWFGQISRYELFYSTIILGSASPVIYFFKEQTKKIASISIVIIVLLGIFGTIGMLTSPQTLNVYTSSFLLAVPPIKEIVHFGIFLIILSVFVNVVIMGSWKLLNDKIKESI